MNPESIPQNNPNPESSPQGIWQHLPEETPEAFSAFAIYLELGSDATLQDVAEKTGKSLGAIKNLSWRHNWRDRAAAWRQHLANATLVSLKTENVQHHKLWNARLQTNRERNWERLQKMEMFCDQ